jgi:anthranilate synthase
MLRKSLDYVAKSGVQISRSAFELPTCSALDSITTRLDTQRGGLLKSSYEYPGRYKRWAVGFVNPPIEIVTLNNSFTISALNERGKYLLPYINKNIRQQVKLISITCCNDTIFGAIQTNSDSFKEEERSRQPSIFNVIRSLLDCFFSCDDEYLGLYGTFGYDLIFQFEAVDLTQDRTFDQRDLVLYLPDEIVIVDYHLQKAFNVQYEFKTVRGSTHGLPRTGKIFDPIGSSDIPIDSCDHLPGAYADLVRQASEYFRQGYLFEVVPSQSFFQEYPGSPVKLFDTLQKINPSPYGFIFNLGGEYLVGSSPEMFVRVEGSRVETCPISGTIYRGKNAIEDAHQVRLLLNSYKDECELTMCTDVDRSDKSRVCKPGSVQVIGRRQVEFYSHVIHTVDHVEGTLNSGFDSIDAFLTHVWAVTVTGAPKKAAIQFIERHELSPRRWYGGAVGVFKFNGDLNTGLVIRTVRLKDSVAEIRVGATLLYDSVPEDEEEETIVKAAAMMQAIETASTVALFCNLPSSPTINSSSGKRVLLIDHEDSFVHVLANYIRQTGAEVTTLRYGFSSAAFERESPDLVVLSPGPGTPSDFQLHETILKCLKGKIPLFGVCLGLQGIVETFGGKLGILNPPMHGKTSTISVIDPDSRLFHNVPSSFEAGRYHSLHALQTYIPPSLKITAVSEDNVVMAVEHISLPVAAVQFHPESIMTLKNDVGSKIIENVIRQYIKPRIYSLSAS